MIRCVLIGGGGHARVVLEIVQAEQPGCVVGVLDPRPGIAALPGVPLLGGDDLLPGLAADGFTHFLLGIGSVAGVPARALVRGEGSRCIPPPSP